MPKFQRQIIKEHRALNNLLKKEHYDLIISDNCYGLWNRKVKSVIITHQLNLKVPASIRFLQPLFNKINQNLIRNFTLCWIPDFQDVPNLSGSLSHPVPADISSAYIGPLTRFIEIESPIIADKQGNRKNILFIISGPEKQRTCLEVILTREFNSLKKSFDCTLIRGLPLEPSKDLPENWYNHLSSEEMQRKIFKADYIVCRSGYSSIMDLSVLKKSAILIPTPGQTEQEYLARHLSNNKQFICQDQDKTDIREGIRSLEEKSTSNLSMNTAKQQELLKNELVRVLSME
jgi:UDP-N-acetylglucosamine transferase subunit ALG13